MKFTVVGGGTAGYLTVLYFLKKHKDVTITWIYPENNKPIGVGEATVPYVTNFLKDLGIDIEDVIGKIGGSLKIGARFDNWSGKGSKFCHPFGNTDKDSVEIEWLMQNNIIPLDILERYDDLAMNFDVRDLVKYLDEEFKKYNNLKIERRFIKDVQEIEDDIVIDCTGFAKSLINAGQPENFKSISHIIPNNRALAFKTNYTDIDNQQTAYTVLTATNKGWIWKTPLKNAITFGYIFNDKDNVKDEFIQFVENTLQTKIDSSKILEIPMITGRNIKHSRHQGSKIIYSIGLSSFFIEPLEASGLYLTAFGIELLDKLLQGEITEEFYNSEYNREFDAVTDFISAYYRYSSNTGEYWDEYKHLQIEKHRKNALFPARSWHYILSGLGEEDRRLKIEAESILKIRKGLTYKEWLNAKNFT
jgi:tryptophan halogenase